MKFHLTFSNGFMAENPWCDGRPATVPVPADDWGALTVGQRRAILDHWREGYEVQGGDRFGGMGAVDLPLLRDIARRAAEKKTPHP